MKWMPGANIVRIQTMARRNFPQMAYWTIFKLNIMCVYGNTRAYV